MMWDFIKIKHAYIPGVKRVTCWLQYSSHALVPSFELSTYQSLSRMDELAHRLKMVGVKFGLISNPFFKDTPCGHRIYNW